MAMDGYQYFFDKAVCTVGEEAWSDAEGVVRSELLLPVGKSGVHSAAERDAGETLRGVQGGRSG